MPPGPVFKVVFYCPDRHVVYDGRTPYEHGIGGGVTARIRMARALAQAGQQVSVICNCRQAAVIDGVAYVPLDQIQPLSVDVLIANTSGGDYDLRPMLDLPVEAGLKLVWMSGVDPPANLEIEKFDGVYAKSNFLRQRAETDWGFPKDVVWVFYNGFDEGLYSDTVEDGPRNSHRLLYGSHPSKGLDTAVEITRRLRMIDERFHLVVCGGEALWGRSEGGREDIPGVHYAGLLPQPELAKQLQTSAFSLALQSRSEPFGMVVTESQRAGCIVLASPVGAIPELVQDGVNGLMIPGDHRSETVRQQAAESILALASQPEKLRRMQAAAQKVPWSTDLIARAWIQHWRALLDNWSPPHMHCPHCGEIGWRLTDGVHCLQCRQYNLPIRDRGEPI